MGDRLLYFIQSNSPDGGFLQSSYWKKFQESVGRETFSFSEKDENDDIIIHAHIISHDLPLVGKYFYLPRGPIIIQNSKFKIQNYNSKIKSFLNNLIKLAKKNNIRWIRFEPNGERELNVVRENLPSGYKIKKSAVDVQPREILVLDITKSEEDILAGMKQKTRYNVRLAEKKGVKALASREKKHINDFCRLVEITARRDKIVLHSENYYRKMFEAIPPEVLKLYVAEYGGKTIAANLVLFFGRTATYMHGASDNVHRDAMAPHLLQWRAIRDARKAGYGNYDLGGVKVSDKSGKSWAGVTKFKMGFAPETRPIEFPGCYDAVLNSGRYDLYRVLQKIKRIFQ